MTEPTYETFQRACEKCGSVVDHTEKRAPGGVLVGVSVTQHPCKGRMEMLDEADE